MERIVVSDDVGEVFYGYTTSWRGYLNSSDWVDMVYVYARRKERYVNSCHVVDVVQG